MDVPGFAYSEIVFYLSPDLRCLFASPAATDFLGVDLAVLLNQPLHNWIHASQRNIISPLSLEAQAGVLNLSLLHANGSSLNLPVRTRLRRDAAGEINSIVITGSEEASLPRQVEQHLHAMRLIHQAGAEITRTFDQNQVNAVVHRTIAHLMDCDSFLISSYDPREKLIRAEYVFHEGEVVNTAMLPPLPFDDETSSSDKGTQGFAIRTGQSILINQFDEHLVEGEEGYYYDSGETIAREEAPDDGTEETQSALIVPLKLDDQVTGVIQVFSFRRNAYTEDHLLFVEAIAPYAAIATTNARLFRQTRFQANRLNVLHAIDQAILAKPSFQDIAVLALQHMQSLLHFDRGGIFTRAVADPTQPLALVTATETPPEAWTGLEEPPGADVMMEELADGDGCRYAVPILLDAHVTGMIVVIYTGYTRPTPAEIEALVEVAAQLAIALQTLYLDAQLRQQKDELERQVTLRTQRLQEALTNERHLSETKARLMSMISHELRNPLTAIMTSTYLLTAHAASLDQEHQQKHLFKIQFQAERMKQLMEDTLIWGRTETAGMNPRFEPCDLQALCQQACEEFGAGYPEHHLTYQVIGVPRLIQLDRELLYHLLSNLLSNAFKYSDPATTVACELTYAEQNVILSIQDQGIGIPAEALAHLGEPFFRARNVEKVQGTGLGLALIYRIVEVHRGTMQVESQVDQGTTIYVNLPMTQQVSSGK